MARYNVQVPLSDADVNRLELGDMIYLSGMVFTCRSRLQKYILDEKHDLPFLAKDRNVLIHVGPVIVREGSSWKLMAFTPTSSIRFEKWGARSIEQWGLKAIIGKTTMGRETAKVMKEQHCIHACPMSISSNQWIDSIEVDDVFLFEELGTIEAAWQLRVKELGPFLVDIDAKGNSFFDAMDHRISGQVLEAYKALNIPEGFQYTELWTPDDELPWMRKNQ